MWDYLWSGLAGLVLCYFVIAAIVGTYRAVIDIQDESGLAPFRFTLELGKGMVFLVGAIVILTYLVAPASYIWTNYSGWILGALVVWLGAGYAIPERFWRIKK